LHIKLTKKLVALEGCTRDFVAYLIVLVCLKILYFFILRQLPP
jgi:hypothetical protein